MKMLFYIKIVKYLWITVNGEKHLLLLEQWLTNL